VPEIWSALLAGKTGAGPITRFDSAHHKTHFACEVKGYDPAKYFDAKEVRRLDRFIQFALVAGREAIADSGVDLTKVDRDEFGVIMGSGVGGLEILEEQHTVLIQKGANRVSPLLVPRMIVNMVSGQLSIAHGLRGPNTSIVTACTSGTNAVGEAMKTIQRGQATMMLAGGTEAAITPLSIAGFENMHALSRRNDSPETASRPFSATRDGFVMGEGAGVLVLEEYEHAKRRGARIHAELTGYGMSADAYHITSPALDGDGAMRSMNNALKDAKMSSDKIGYINAHGTSTDLNDKIETLAIKRVFGDRAYKIPVSSTKSMVGHLLGAAGAVESVFSVLSIMHNIAPPTINLADPDPECDLDYVTEGARSAKIDHALSNSFGFGGHNATLIFSRAS